MPRRFPRPLGTGFGGVWSPRPTKRFGGARQRNVGPCALRGTGDADCRVGPAGLLAMTEVDRLSFRGAKRRGNPFHFQRGTGRCGHRPLRPFLGRGTRHAGVVVPYGDGGCEMPISGPDLIFGSQNIPAGRFPADAGVGPFFPCRPEGTAGRAFRARPPHL